LACLTEYTLWEYNILREIPPRGIYCLSYHNEE
jgi:hypothetical protein